MDPVVVRSWMPSTGSSPGSRRPGDSGVGAWFADGKYISGRPDWEGRGSPRLRLLSSGLAPKLETTGEGR